MKICTKCQCEKEISDFSTNSKAKDGKHSWCRACVNEQRKGKKEYYAKYDANKSKEYRDKVKHTESFKRIKRNADKRYRDNMGETLKEKKRLYYADKQHLRRAEYQRNKQGYIARAYQRSKNIQKLTPVDADKKAIQLFYDRAKQLTESTGIKHEVDHIIPISKGGMHHQDNLQVLLWIDNRKKGNKMICGRTFEKFKKGGS